MTGRMAPAGAKALAVLTMLALVPAAALPAARLDALPPLARDAVRVYVVRHGQAGLNVASRRRVREEDMDRLTTVGRRQARRTADALASRGVGAVIASPARRARETADVIARRLGVAVEVDPRLQPLELGRDPKGYAGAWATRARGWSRGQDPVLPGGESLRQGAGRLRSVLESLRSSSGRRHVVLVAHNELIGPFVALARGKPPWAGMPRGVGNASVTVVDLLRDGRTVLRARGLRP